MRENYRYNLSPGEDKVKALASLIREVEADRNIKLPFDVIRRIAKKNHFTFEETAELEVMYF